MDAEEVMWLGKNVTIICSFSKLRGLFTSIYEVLMFTSITQSYEILQLNKTNRGNIG